MEKPEMLEALLDLANAAGLEIRSVGAHRSPAGEPPPASGVCRVKNDVWIVLSAADPPEVQIQVLAAALRTHAADWLEGRFVPPAVRELL